MANGNINVPLVFDPQGRLDKNSWNTMKRILGAQGLGVLQITVGPLPLHEGGSCGPVPPPPDAMCPCEVWKTLDIVKVFPERQPRP